MLQHIFEQTKKSASRTPKTSMNLEAEIAKLAYQYFVERGYQHGHGLEDWLRAEKFAKSKSRKSK